jgi:hypothetical protein
MTDDRFDHPAWHLVSQMWSQRIRSEIEKTKARLYQESIERAQGEQWSGIRPAKSIFALPN